LNSCHNKNTAGKKAVTLLRKALALEVLVFWARTHAENDIELPQCTEPVCNGGSRRFGHIPRNPGEAARAVS
jgi:hypothetical protein